MKSFSNPRETTSENLEPIERMILLMQQAGIRAFEQCGPWETCLCALVLALDPKCRTYRLLESLPANRSSYNEEDVLNILARLGYFSRTIKIRAADMDPRLFPSLFIDKDDVPSLLIAQEDGRFKIYKNQSISYLSPAQLESMQGRAVLFERFDENRTATSKFAREGSGHNWFRALLNRFNGTFAQILSAGLIINLISLTTPLMIMLIYNRVIATGTLDVLPMIVLGMTIAIAFEIVLRAVRSRGLSWIAARMDNIVGNKIFAHLTGLSPSLIERASVSAQIARIKTFESIRDFFCGSVFLSFIEMPFVFLAALAIYFIAGPLVLVPLGMMALYSLLFYGVYRYVRKAIRMAAKASSARQQFAIESFEKIRGLRAYGLTGLWEKKFRDLSGKEMMAHFHLNFLGMIGETLGNSLTIVSAIATIAFGAHMVWAGTLSTGALVATMILAWRVITPFYSACTMIPRLEQIRHSILQVNNLMDLETEEQKAKMASQLSAIRGNIVFSDVTLKYNENDSDLVLKDTSFTARAGDLVLITGENGAGKSSLLKMAKGLYKPSSGSLLIDGFDIRQLDPQGLRKQIAYIPQQYDFFEGSILENLRLCNPLASEADIRAALDLAEASADIAQLPDGLDSIISRYSIQRLPGHLAMRLSLARLYLHTAPILLIDEIPNILLSGKTGKNLREYLARCKGKRTCMMVSYREDFLKMADSIIYLRRGESPVVGNTETMMNIVLEAA